MDGWGAEIQTRLAAPLSVVLNKGSVFVPRAVPLARPSLCPDSAERILLGTDDLAGLGRHRIIGVIGDLQDCDADITVFSHPTPETAIVAHGTTIAAVHIDREFRFKKVDFESVHTDWLRELAPGPRHHHRFASGGFDGMLCTHDIGQEGRCLSQTRVGDIISSLRWGAYGSDQHCVSVTTDMGALFVYDTRTPMCSPAIMVDAQKLMLYAHHRLGHHSVVLGFGDGELLEVDLRNGEFVFSGSDPATTSIGDLLVANGTVLVSGEQATYRVALWKKNTSRQELEHLVSGAAQVPGLDTTAPAFVRAVFAENAETIVTADSQGLLAALRIRYPK